MPGTLACALFVCARVKMSVSAETDRIRSISSDFVGGSFNWSSSLTCGEEK